MRRGKLGGGLRGAVARAAAALGQPHPHPLHYLMWGVWSLNERAAGRPGRDLPPPSTRWIADILEASGEQAEAVEQLLDRTRQWEE